MRHLSHPTPVDPFGQLRNGDALGAKIVPGAVDRAAGWPAARPETA